MADPKNAMFLPHFSTKKERLETKFLPFNQMLKEVLL